MGNEHLKNNQFDKAIEVYTEAIELDKCNIKLNSIIYANRGLVFQKNKKYDQAIQDFDRSIELNADYFKAYLRRGETRLLMGDHSAAQADFQKVAEIDPS